MSIPYWKIQKELIQLTIVNNLETSNVSVQIRFTNG